MAGNREGWSLLSSHGEVLFYVAANPDCTIKEITEATSLTRRSVWRLVSDLQRAEMLVVRRQGRRHHYSVDLDAPFRHPVLNGLSLRPILGGMVEQAAALRS